jgi:demethylmenaquinone methyltransferase/2-methoxy-6-polyprenyl-1,4-benzoquinol methylase
MDMQRREMSLKIRSMFSAIASRYDLLNTVLSAGRDDYWRREAVDRLHPQANRCYLDLATGTADIVLEIGQRKISGITLCGVDFSLPMLRLARRKLEQHGLTADLQLAMAEALPFADASFHGAISAFGVRNFADLELGLRELHRVLKPGGRLVILEFSLPAYPPLRWLYSLYFDHILPFIGKIVSRHRTAYSYLPNSVVAFPSPGEFAAVLAQRFGFSEIEIKPLTFGIVTLYTGIRHG